MLFMKLMYLFLLVLFGTFFTSKKRFLNALLLLEIMVLMSLVFTIFLLVLMTKNLNIFLILLTLGVCEAGLGLGLLMVTLKSESSDYFNYTF
uniref:NADH dehydrogenase subunit 4L n=1 Tax=Megalophaedusa kurozuensis TaxID=1885761 RepID=A0A224AAJ4_9EUPU|nr:NADH dehydrogenase subunit 4L [Megalophaedusa kurozuensis]